MRPQDRGGRASGARRGRCEGLDGLTAHDAHARRRRDALDFVGDGLITFLALAAALVLLPHRTGDSNIRAVWLFSRNDAIGNAVVVAAAGLVAFTGTPWPDLVAAVLIAGLFLHSSWSIVRDARRDFRCSTCACCDEPRCGRVADACYFGGAVSRKSA